MRTVAVMSLLLAAATVAAEPPGRAPYVWRNVKIGAGGFIPGILFSRAEKGLVYLRTDMGGCYRWDDAAKRWIPLQDAIGVSAYHGVESIAPDPRDADVVYAACGMYRGEGAAILRSRDRGDTWEISPVPFRMGGNEDGRGLGERLAIDPSDTRILYFGSRHDGLQRSTDRGATWAKVDSFPLKGRGLPARGEPTNGGLSFVVIDRSGRSIFVGSADPGDQHLFRSDDAGSTWAAVEGGPKPGLLPAQAQLTDDGATLFVTYANALGPNGVTDGAVWKLDTKSGHWTDITPDKRPDRPAGGYMGFSLDRQRPGTLAVATMNRWSPGDTVWRSTDGGATWKDIAERSTRDVSATPFLRWGKPEPKLGWWMAALAIDPFDSDHAAYATGATIYATREFSKVSAGEPTRWKPWVEGIEQTAVLCLASPPTGASLVSGFGDIGGFVHDDLAVSPRDGMHANPMFSNTNHLDFAGCSPNVVVRSGTPHEGQAPLADSEDGGRSWQPLIVPSLPRATGREWQRTPPITVSADGKTFIVMSAAPVLTRDRGKTWVDVKGLPDGCRAVPDRVDAQSFYAIDFPSAALYVSDDGGATFAKIESSGLPSDLAADRPTWDGAPWPLHATPGKRGDLWLVGRAGLLHSPDAGRTFARVEGDGVKVEMLTFGKPPPGSNYPALFAVGTRGTLKAIWRSDDAGKSWLRVNDDRHQYGTRFRCLAGDPRVFGRVYVGTDGRGIVYGEPAVDGGG